MAECGLICYAQKYPFMRVSDGDVDMISEILRDDFLLLLVIVLIIKMRVLNYLYFL